MSTKTQRHRVLALITGVFWALVVASFTLLKSSVSLPGLWDADVHQRREIRLIPLQGFVDPYIWWGPVLNLVGNIGLFVPVGFLLVIALRPRRPILTATLTGFVLSLAIEVAQFVFARGYSDIDDLIFNTLGALLGAWIASRVPTKAVTMCIGFIVAVGMIAVLPFAVDMAQWVRAAVIE
ncbi:VanZ family protein [Corynebacterium pilosum]|uniref:VanZ family protein n=1 Tax=Corynebacterium pilosum TaxID=35756 RepID=UPI00035D869D|nr:VanZ family protein [Corynebacterium pilosum]